MGYSLILLSFLYLLNFVSLSPVYLMGFSIAALLFSLNDLFEFKADEKNDPFKYKYIKSFLFIFAVISFMIVPFLTIEWPKEIIEKVNSFTFLLSIGIIFYLLGLKQDKVTSQKLESIMRDMVQAGVNDYTNNELPKLIDNLLDENFIRETTLKTVNEINEKSNYKQ